MMLRQLFEPESCTYTYLLADIESKEAALIDPILEMIERDLSLISELGLKLKYIIDTHVHADHITASGEIKKRTLAQIAMSGASGVQGLDIPLQDGQILKLGTSEIKILATPGHTDSCLCLLSEDFVITGDALLIGGCGRTDFQEGSSKRLYQSVHEKLFILPESTRVFPGHDYQGKTSSTIGQEKQSNPRLGGGKSLAEFEKIMSELKLASPKRIHEALPANRVCGRVVQK